MKASVLSAILLILLSLPAVFAQAQPAADPPKDQPPQEKETAYVRRFSVALRVSVIPLDQIKGGSRVENFATGPTEVTYTTTPTQRRVGAGLGLQLALSDRYSLNADVLYRRFKYKNVTEIRTGVDSTSTTADERTLRTITDNADVTAWEVPLLLRRYSQSRFRPGAMWFVEAGPAIRKVGKLKGTRDDNGTFSDVTPDVSKKIRPGVVAGIGLHLTDDFGIRVIPEVRYTYWFSRTIDSRPARSEVHQAEVLIGISF